jgi:hypothetical protein
MTTFSGALVTLNNNQLFTAGRYSAYITPYNVGSLVYGQDYTESLQLYSGSMPNGVTANWSFPTTTAPLVKSFISVGYGDYLNTTPPTRVVSSRISDITSLKEGINFSYSGNAQGFNVITDIFLTNVAGDNTTNAAEVEIFLHSPTAAQAWVASQRSLGTITIYGITWDVAEATNSSGNPDYSFMPANGADVASGAVNIKSMLQYLVNHAGLSSSLYFNGLATGVEASSGSGSWTLNNFGVSYSTTAPAPVVTISLANQTGQTISGKEYTYDPKLTGTADANATVTLYDSGAAIAQVTADSTGAWTYSGSSLSTGYHDITATEKNSYGNSSSSSVVFMLNKAVNSITEFFNYVTGQGTNGIYTAAPTLNGWTTPNTAVTISDLGSKLASVSSDSSGYYSYQTSNLAIGAHNIAVSSTTLYGSTATKSLAFTFA